MRTISLKERVLNRIENVRDWLDRAEEGYRADEYLQGEMNLNLAQAELKKAWEESRQHTGQQGQVIPLSPPGEKPVVLTRRRRGLPVQNQHRYGLVAAVVLLLLLNLTPLMRLNQDNVPAASRVQDIHVEQVFEEHTLGVELPAQVEGAEPQNESDSAVVPAASVLQDQTGTVQAASRTVYSETPLHFDVTTDQLVYTPVKEVKPEPAKVVEAKVTPDNSFALQSRQLNTGGKSTDKWPTYTGSTANSTPTTIALATNEVSTIPEAKGIVSHEGAIEKYDVDQLVNLAKETLTSKR